MNTPLTNIQLKLVDTWNEIIPQQSIIIVQEDEDQKTVYHIKGSLLVHFLKEAYRDEIEYGYFGVDEDVEDRELIDCVQNFNGDGCDYLEIYYL